MASRLAQKLPFNAIQLAVYNKLSTALSGVCDVVDGTEENQDMPYVTIGPAWNVDDSTKTGWGTQNVFQINVWAEDDRMYTVNDIMDKCLQAIQDDGAPISVSGYTLKFRNLDRAQVMENPDRGSPDAPAVVRHGIIDFRLVLRQD